MIPILDATPRSRSAHAELLAELRARGFAGDLSSSAADRVVFATDNSVYQVAPQAVAFPRTTDDLVRITRVMAEPRFAAVAIAPRGGATGTNGQSLTDGLVVDVSRHMNAILEVNPTERWVRVQAGVVKDQLNAALACHGLFFAPELSTSNRATIGGMVSTDACGQGSCLYGKTSDHVLELTTVLADGTVWHSTPLNQAELDTVAGRPDLVGAIHRVMHAIGRDHAALIAQHFPRLNRSLTGYDLAHIRNRNGLFDLNSILCGSEGTLGLIAEAKLNVLPIPADAALVVICYGSFDAALRDAPALAALGAASVETVDSHVLGLAREDPVWDDVGAFFPDEADGPFHGVNIVEFVGHAPGQVEALLARALEALDGNGAGRLGYAVAREAVEVECIWTMRKKAVGLLGNTPSNKRPIAFVEDTAVPPERLADYIAEFRAALDRRGLDYGMFGHVDAGVLHVRPALDMKDPAQQALIREVTEEIVALTSRYGGLLWGEHGKGIRSEFSPRFFGPLYPFLQQIKATFDPRNQFNPGKIAAPEGRELLRVDGVPFRGALDRAIPAAVRNGFDEALHCNGNGACFNWDPDDAMCPSWKATRERRHSPKGRAALMREWLRQLAEAGSDPLAEAAALRRSGRRWRPRSRSGHHPSDFSHAVKEAMDGCLACKSCVGQCPVKVDVPGFRAKFLELYHGRYRRPMRDHIVARLEGMAPRLALAPRLANAATKVSHPVLRGLGLVATPALSKVNLRRALRERGVATATPAALRALDATERTSNVVIVQDAFTSFYDTPVLLALIDLLAALGFRPWVAPFLPNGKPLHVHGFLGPFARVAARNAVMLRDLAEAGVELIGVDPSMTLTYRSEYVTALPLGQAPRVLLPQEWLARRLRSSTVPTLSGHYELLPHCTERTTAGASLRDWQAVFARFGLTLDVVQAGCCGMAGTYGHEAEHRATSEQIYGQSWAGRVAGSRGRTTLLADGYSCRTQTHLTGNQNLAHPAQALLAALAAQGNPATAGLWHVARQRCREQYL